VFLEKQSLSYFQSFFQKPDGKDENYFGGFL
jgi:hypothetical protein